MKGIAAVTENAVEMPFENRDELPQYGDPTGERASAPLLPEASRRAHVPVLPEMFEIVLQHVHDEQRPVRAEQLPQPHAFVVGAEIGAIAQQQPARALDHAALRAQRAGPSCAKNSVNAA